VTSGEISEGFRSKLNAFFIIPKPRRLAQEIVYNASFYLNAMSMPIEELAVQAKERSNDEYARFPINISAGWPGMAEPLKRLQSVWCESVNVTNTHGVSESS
jgi:hypothetical protein